MHANGQTKDIDFFFIDPTISPVIPGPLSILYLLRRDISVCFGINPNNGEQFSEPCTLALFPGVMAICAGIDLLGKFFAGNDTTGKVESRFRKFSQKYFHLSKKQAITVFQLRNSLLHSFGLYSEKSKKLTFITKFFNFLKSGLIKFFKPNSKKLGLLTQKKWRFILSTKQSQLISSLEPDKYEINIEIFRSEFEKAITEYEKDFKREATLQVNFSKMFVNYGGLQLG